MADAIHGAADIAGRSLPRRPRLAPWLVPIRLDDERMELRGAQYALPLHSPLFIALYEATAPLLQGQHSLDEIEAALRGRYLPGVVLFFLKLLRSHGALQEAPEADSPTDAPTLAFFSHYGADPALLLRNLRGATVILVGDAALTAPIAGHLRPLGLTLEGPEADWGRADLVIAARIDPGQGAFSAINRRALTAGARWLHVALEGTTGLLGPMVVPRQTACYDCYQTRLSGHRERDGHAAWLRATAEAPVDEGHLRPHLTALAAQAALEAVRALSAFAPATTFGQQWELDAGSPAAALHPILRAPRCPTCGPVLPPLDPWDRRGGAP